ncbi:AAA family ATPase [Granulosicoccus antarcticus]|uniref:Uncharacterized protein n=1 Tax=Granulosicoccus antarcticus IMCC3135 TaxID=1192854 RepID=A0A2Z2P0Y1_9GAMM|nr:AAA family ATPase [Granulosicoccus antarcticus]ASJ76041.1 hypothetical protein IMCC3135_29960 [Granulosicoccus antarcticus IMCC3135]
MLLIDAAMYLPVSESTLLTVLDETASWENTLQRLEIPEIAALFLLAHLPALRDHKRLPAERVLAETIESCKQQVDRDGLAELTDYALKNLNRQSVAIGSELLVDFRIALLDEETVRRKAYLHYTGLWDYGFQQKYRESLASQRVSTTIDSRQFSLSAEQSRVYREFESQKDEHMHIQGYAGTGKSSLIKTLLGMFETSGGKILVLAAQKRQLDALSIDSSSLRHVHKCTFSELAEMVIPVDFTSSANRNMLRKYSTRATMPDSVIVQQLGVKPSNEFGTDQIIKAIRATVFSFCQSGDAQIQTKHIPASYASTFDLTLRAVVCQYAKELWNTLLSPPTPDFKPQIRGFHKIKWAALNGWSVPEKYTHVLVDECHDLPKPVFQILACGPQARSTLGDDYQNLKGQSTRHSGQTRLREMVHSVRSGHELESIINPIIATHPSGTKARFQGNNLSRLDIQYYQKAVVPDVPAVILVSDTWGLFEWVQRLANQNINPVLMSDHKDLDMFVQDCIELKSGGGSARHGELFRFNSWDRLASSYQNNPGFRRINQLLEKGYGQKNWQQTYMRLGTTRSHTHTHAVSLIENVRNLEFDNVMLAPDVFNAVETASRAAFSSAIYVGVTRARKRLMVPEELRHWIEEISATGKVDNKPGRRTRA